MGIRVARRPGKEIGAIEAIIAEFMNKKLRRNMNNTVVVDTKFDWLSFPPSLHTNAQKFQSLAIDRHEISAWPVPQNVLVTAARHVTLGQHVLFFFLFPTTL
jgi:hypothetical protein